MLCIRTNVSGYTTSVNESLRRVATCCVDARRRFDDPTTVCGLWANDVGHVTIATDYRSTFAVSLTNADTTSKSRFFRRAATVQRCIGRDYDRLETGQHI